MSDTKPTKCSEPQCNGDLQQIQAKPVVAAGCDRPVQVKYTYICTEHGNHPQQHWTDVR